jgi:hypothetical protein
MPLTGEMFQGPDVVVGEQLSQPAPPVHRQDGGERIALMRPPGFRIDDEGRGVRSVMISLRLFPGGRAFDGTEIAAPIWAPAVSASWRPGSRRRPYGPRSASRYSL